MHKPRRAATPAPVRTAATAVAALTVTAAALTCVAARPCRAQLGTARILRPRQQTTGKQPQLSHLTIGPALFFGVDNASGTVRTVGSTVLAYERGLSVGRATDAAAQFGGFLYSQGDSYFFQVQGKYYPSRSIGGQISYQRGKDGGDAFTAFGLYNLSSSTRDPQAKVPWDVQVGLGGLFPTDDQPKAFSAFLQLSVGLSRNLTLDTSYWGVYPNSDSSINRVLVGVGYNF